MDAAYNYFKKTAILFAIALLSAAPSFGHSFCKPDNGHSDRVEFSDRQPYRPLWRCLYGDRHSAI